MAKRQNYRNDKNVVTVIELLAEAIKKIWNNFDHSTVRSQGFFCFLTKCRFRFVRRKSTCDKKQGISSYHICDFFKNLLQFAEKSRSRNFVSFNKKTKKNKKKRTAKFHDISLVVEALIYLIVTLLIRRSMFLILFLCLLWWVGSIDKLVNIDKLQYTCTRLRSKEINCKIYRWNLGAKKGKPSNGQISTNLVLADITIR